MAFRDFIDTLGSEWEKKAADAKKAKLEAIALENLNNPYGETYAGVPTLEQEQAQKKAMEDLFSQKEADRKEKIQKLFGMTGTMADTVRNAKQIENIEPQINETPITAPQFVSARDKFQEETGVSASTPTNIYAALAKAKALHESGGGNVWVSNDGSKSVVLPSDVPAPEGFKFLAKINKTDAAKQAIGVSKSNTAAEATKENLKTRLTDTVPIINDETGEIIGRTETGAIKVGEKGVGKGKEDNETIDALLNSIDRLSKIRKTMSSKERIATLIPGGSTLGRLKSAPISSWETEKDLISQRLGKLVEKNRMSDADRKFYLKQINNPASDDEPFDANINTLKTAISEIKSGKSSRKIMKAQNAQGIIIQSVDGGKTWQPIKK